MVGKRIDELAVDRPAPAQLEHLLTLLGGLRNQKLPSDWVAGVLNLLAHADGGPRAELAGWLSTLKIEPADAKRINAAVLQQVQSINDAATRLQLVAAMSPRAKLDDAQLEQLVVDHFLGLHEPDLMGESAKALARIELSEASARRLVEQLDMVQPLDLMVAVSSIAAVGQDSIDSSLLERLKSLPAARTLAFDQVTSLYRNRSEGLRGQVQSTVETLNKPPADVEAKLDELLGKLKSGEVTRGFQVFRGTKAACSACHRIGYVGGTIGPELTRIGTMRTRRALLEAIVFPMHASSKVTRRYVC